MRVKKNQRETIRDYDGHHFCDLEYDLALRDCNVCIKQGRTYYRVPFSQIKEKYEQMMDFTKEY